MRFYAPRFSIKLVSYHFFNGGLRFLLLRVRVRLPSNTVLKVVLRHLVSNLTAPQKKATQQTTMSLQNERITCLWAPMSICSIYNALFPATSLQR